MRVLLVNAYPVGNKRGVERFDKSRQHVLRVVKELEKTEVTQVELVERARNELDEFLFEMHSEFANPQSITNFDLLTRQPESDVHQTNHHLENGARKATIASLFSKLAFTSPPETGSNNTTTGIELQQQQQVQSRNTGTKMDAFGGDRPEVESSSTTTSGNQRAEAMKPSSHSHTQPHSGRRVRVPQKNELEQPYCAIHKFNRMRNEEKQHFYSVVNDAPYVSAAEREILESQKSKLKWTAGPFRTAIGKGHDPRPSA